MLPYILFCLRARTLFLCNFDDQINYDIWPTSSEEVGHDL